MPPIYGPIKPLVNAGTELTGYPNVSVYHDFRYHPKQVISGVFDDWMFSHLGIFAFTVEQWDIVGRAGIKDRKFIEWMRDHPHEDDLKILQWADENAGEDAYVEWYEFEHPQLGKLEIGGWNQYVHLAQPTPSFHGRGIRAQRTFCSGTGKNAYPISKSIPWM